MAKKGYRFPKGNKHPRWNGGRTKNIEGYNLILMPNHPRSGAGRYVRAAVLIAEKTLGKPLPIGAVVHHIDENPSNDSSNNLVICQDHLYHKFLHRRVRALRACGNINWIKCSICKKYDNPSNLYLYKTHGCTVGYHNRCHADKEKNRRHRNEKTIT